MDEDDYESLPETATSLDHMVAGAAAGIMEHCIIYPVDVVKVIFIFFSVHAVT
jgi:solute carrier family 25 iron transporter 28/37